MEAQRDLFDAGLVHDPRLDRGQIKTCTAAPIGSGPDGETCGSCRHLYRQKMSNTYLKCGLMKRYWTGGAATDVKVRWAACKYWEASE